MNATIQALEELGISFYYSGVIEGHEWYKTDRLTDEQKQQLTDKLPNVKFQDGHKTYAPEIKFTIIIS